MTYQEENQKLIELFAPCRVTDVRDGMDWMGYYHYGSCDPAIQALFPKHAVGIARTARYVPYEGSAPMVIGEEYSKWAAMYYKEICYDPWVKDLQKGDFACLDLAGVDVGLIGSNNILTCERNGCVGILINGVTAGSIKG